MRISSGKVILKRAVPLLLSIAFMTERNPVAADLLNKEHCTVEFDSRDTEIAHVVGTAIDESWDEVAQAVGADSESPPVRVILPPSLEEFRKLAGGYDREWVIAVAVHPHSLIVVKPPRLVTPSLTSLRQTVRHELVHIMLSRVSNVHNIPRWLNEGIAMRVSGEMAVSAEWVLAAAVLRGNLIPLDELDEHFPDDHERAGLAYAESLSAVDYIAETHGEQALPDLIRALRRQSFDEALAASFGLDLQTLGERWIRTVRISPYVVTLVGSSFALWLMAALAIVAFFRKRRLGRQRELEWEREKTVNDTH
jgi:hypothetical protein